MLLRLIQLLCCAAAGTSVFMSSCGRGQQAWTFNESRLQAAGTDLCVDVERVSILYKSRQANIDWHEIHGFFRTLWISKKGQPNNGFQLPFKQLSRPGPALKSYSMLASLFEAKHFEDDPRSTILHLSLSL